MAAAASRTTNPLLLLLIVAVVSQVVAARRTDAPWALGFKTYLYLGLAVIVIRVVFRMLLDGQFGAHVLFTLPEVPLPAAAMGIRLGGPVSAEGLFAALCDGLRLATLLICVGAANVLANPKRLLKAMPDALHEIGVAVTVALTMAPQLIESGQRVRRARRLRAEESRRFRVFREIAIPVMTDALDRSLLLAAAMDSRGYGRRADVPVGARVATGGLLLAGLMGICIGTYSLLDGSAPGYLGGPLLVAGTTVGWIGVMVSGRRVPRTRYRPDPWRVEEWSVTVVGLTVAALMVVVGSVTPSALLPSIDPLQWPTLAAGPTLAILLGVLPAWLAPPVEGRSVGRASSPLHRRAALEAAR
jgi:energy-coupling factor transport system permease protein